MRLVGAFIVLITGFWFAEGMFSIETLLWFLLGIALLIPETIKELVIYIWKAKYERK